MYSNIDFKAEYLHWIQKNTETLLLGESSTRLTTPFIDMNNDCIEIYIQACGSTIVLTDLGETLSNLEFANFKLTDKRNKILREIAAAYNVSLADDGALHINCTQSDFGLKANSLIQCMLKASDMLMLSDRNVKTLFSEDVQSFFIENNIIYTPNVNFVGKSSFYANYEFVLPRFGEKPERFVTPINHAREDIIRSTIFTWEDIKPNRDPTAELFAIINDSDKEININSITALSQYGIECLAWSNRENYISKLRTA